MSNNISAELKKLRLERGYSLEEMQKKTKIHLSILKAIEGDSLTNLSPVYLKGFIKIYCKALGVDPKDYIEDYKEPQGMAINALPESAIEEETKKAAPFSSVGKLNASSFKIPPQAIKAAIFAVVVLVAVTGLVKAGKFIVSKRKQYLVQKPTVIPVKEKKAGKKEKIAKTSGQVAKPQETKALKNTTSGITLWIKTKENCVVNLKSDGKVVFSRVLEKGRADTWKAKDKMELSLGNAGAVELEVNGQRFTHLGGRGQSLKNIVITKEGMNIAR